MSLHSLPDDAPKPRLCYLKKDFPEQGYGFDLFREKLRGQFIGNVDADTLASSAGLEKGDRILAVNGVSVPQDNHAEVVQRIREDPLQCRLVVISESGFLWYNSRKMPVPIADLLLPPPPLDTNYSEMTADSNDHLELTCDADKISTINSPQTSVKSSISDKKDDTGNPVAKSPLRVVKKLSATGAENYHNSTTTAEQAEKPAPPIVGSLVYNESGAGVIHDDVATPVTDENDTLTNTSTTSNSTTMKEDDHLTDSRRPTETGHQQNGTITETEAELIVQNGSTETVQNGTLANKSLPQSPVKSKRSDASSNDTTHQALPRLCKLRKTYADQEYGFNLHAEKNRGHFVGTVDPGSPAHLAGMLKDHRIVGVNGTLIYAKTPHKEVVSLIKQMPLNADLLIVSPELDAEYACKQIPFSFSRAENFPSLSGDDDDAVDCCRGGVLVTASPVKAKNDDDDRTQSSTVPSSPSTTTAVREQKNADKEEVKSPMIAADRCRSTSGAAVSHGMAEFHLDDNNNTNGVENGEKAANGSVDNFSRNNEVCHEEQKAAANGGINSVSQDKHTVLSFETQQPLDETINQKTGNVVVNNNHYEANNEKTFEEKIIKNPVQDMFHMSASEMRERLSKNKKVDPRKEQISIREKYEIVQNL